MRALLAVAAVLLVGACGTTKRAATTTPAARRPPQPTANAADVRFARGLLARVRADAQIDQLASRKGSTDAVRSSAAHRLARDETTIAALTRFLRTVHAAVPPQPLTNPPGWGTLVAVSGYRFDEAYAPLARARAAADAALVRRSALLKRIATSAG